MKPIRLSGHALGYVKKRGFTVAEVEETIRTCPWSPAPKNRLECRKVFPFGQDWNGTFFANKRVHPIFVEAPLRSSWSPFTRIFFEELTMKITYDPEVDALSITFRETTVTTKHLDEGIAADFDAQGHLAGIEILDALDRLGGSEVFRQVILEGIGFATPATTP